MIKLQYSDLNDVATTMADEASKCVAHAKPDEGVVLSHNMLAGIMAAIAKIARETQGLEHLINTLARSR